MILTITDAAFAFAPAAVLVALGAQLPGWEHWPVYVAARAAQFAADTGALESLRARLGAGSSPLRVILGERC